MPRQVSVLDTFTRADAGSPGGNWSQNPNSDGAANFDIVSNALKTNTWSANWWNVSSFDGTSSSLEVGVLVTAAPTTNGRSVGAGFVKSPSGSSSTSNGYSFDLTREATNDTYVINRIDLGVPTVVKSGSFSGHMPTGAIYMLRKTSAGALTLVRDSGGTETTIDTVTDSTHTGSGWYGFLESWDTNVAILDDFSMGEFISGGATDKTATDTGALTSSSSLAASISVTDSIALTEASSTVDNAVTTADTITLTESSVSNADKIASDTISFLEPDVWEDSITSAVDGATLTEGPSALEIGKFTTDSISFGDSGTINKDVNVGETFTVIDASEIFIRNAFDTLTFSESSAASNVNTRSDSANLSESSSATAAAAPSDSAALTESASVSVLVNTGDTLSLIELTGIDAAAPTADSLSLTESATRADLANPDKISAEEFILIESSTIDSGTPVSDSIGFAESTDIVVGILAQDDISLTEIADSNNLIDLVDDFTLVEEVTVDALLDAADSIILNEEVLPEADIQSLDDFGFSESADQPAIAIFVSDDFIATEDSGLQSNELATGDSFTLDDSAVANRLLVASDSISLSESALALNPESVTQELVVNVSVVPRLYKLKKRHRRHKNSRLRG